MTVIKTLGHWSAWQAARVEVVQQAEIERRANDPIEERVVAKIVEKTELNPAPTGDS